MKYLFFGTPGFASAILEKLLEAGLAPAGVVCNPDRPVGRKKIITPPPTKSLAIEHGIPVYQPDDFVNFKFKILNFKFDFFVVAAYSKIIPKDVLGIPKLGTIGVHPSLLPKYRGAAPIQSAILAGEKETGVTLYLMDEKVDHGDIISNSKFQISNQDNYGILEKKLAELSANLLIETLPKFANGGIKPIPQDENRATFTKKFRTEDGRVDLEKDNPIIVERKIRALNPEPGVWTYAKALTNWHMRINPDKRVKLLEAELSEGKLKIKTLQVEGEKPKAV